MPRAHDLHVIPDPARGGWSVMDAGRRLSHHRTQKHAVRVGRRAARRRRVDLVMHGRDGRVRSKDSYGNESAALDKEH
jgi:hypothetical protein